eukprot:c3107_g1_i1.p1 GENE.c3107_g1_i1~~c3107_g1_i1.p1  ORF type:complete len:202 (-),score=3.48 c3107_g1_i1:68-673(-)
MFICLLVLLVVGLSTARQTLPPFQCNSPTTSYNFNYSAYAGVWYEIAKFQTYLGRLYQKPCECTYSIVSPNVSAAEIDLQHICRIGSDSNNWLTANALLFDEQAPGYYKKTNINNGEPTPAIDWFHLKLDTERGYSMEYDCGEDENGTNSYCIHIMSRSREMPIEHIMEFAKYAELELGINDRAMTLELIRSYDCPLSVNQ